MARRLRENEDSELAFLYHPEVSPDNTRCERIACVFKSRQHEAIAFRSMEGLALACNATSVVDNVHRWGGSVFDAVREIFDRRNLCSPAYDVSPFGQGVNSDPLISRRDIKAIEIVA